MPTLVRLRIALADRPGALASVAAAIAARGGNIEAVDVLAFAAAGAADEHRVVDEVTVRFEGEAPIDDLRADLDASGAARVLSSRAAAHRDPVVVALERAHELVRLAAGGRHDEVDDALASAVGELCAAPVAWVERPGPDAHPAATMAATQAGAVAVSADGLPPTYADRLPGGGWLLAVPEPGGARAGRVVLVARGSDAFTSTEIARIEALIAVAG